MYSLGHLLVENKNIVLAVLVQYRVITVNRNSKITRRRQQRRWNLFIALSFYNFNLFKEMKILVLMLKSTVKVTKWLLTARI